MNQKKQTKIDQEKEGFEFIPAPDLKAHFNTIFDKNGYLNELLRNESITAERKIMRIMNELLATVETVDFTKLTSDRQQLYKAVDLCYNILGRTKILSKNKVKTPKELLEVGYEEEMTEFEIQPNELAEEIMQKL